MNIDSREEQDKKGSISAWIEIDGKYRHVVITWDGTEKWDSYIDGKTVQGEDLVMWDVKLTSEKVKELKKVYD